MNGGMQVEAEAIEIGHDATAGSFLVGPAGPGRSSRRRT
jgi:hypothetical protein